MIVGQMAISKFPMWEMCLKDLLTHCDKVYLRFDSINGDIKILDKIPEVCGNKLGNVLISEQPFHKWMWREQLIRMLDGVKPNIVLSPDQDEIFNSSIDIEIKEFEKSDKDCMMFNYTSMPTEDNRIILKGKPYPLFPHMKVFRWKPNLSYNGYHGNALIPSFHKNKWWLSKTQIAHYCFYKKEWIKEKVEKMKTYSVPKYFQTYYSTTLDGFDT